MQARFYLPMYGRFASPDPARDQHFEQTQSWNIYSYVQNNPVMNVDPNGMELRLAFTDSSDIKGNIAAARNFSEAMGYLRTSPTFSKAIATVELSSAVTWVYVQSGAIHEQSGDRIQWDPNGGTALKSDNGEKTGEIQSPAIALGHEIGHRAEELEHPQAYKDNANGKAGVYQDKEEKRNIQKVETPGAKELGEPTRTNHSGEKIPVESPTSRKPEIKKRDEK